MAYKGGELGSVCLVNMPFHSPECLRAVRLLGEFGAEHSLEMTLPSPIQPPTVLPGFFGPLSRAMAERRFSVAAPV